MSDRQEGNASARATAGGIETRGAALARYTRRSRKRIAGWFDRLDAEIFSTLLLHQSRTGVTGATAEIGVHHGKSFIPLCLATLGDEKSLCIDVFGDQHLNTDRSGKGDRDHLMENLARNGVDTRKVEIIADSSANVTPAMILERVGNVRFFSVDGSHTHAMVLNDLALAAAVAARGCILSIDDFHHRDWPDVSRAYFDWHASAQHGFAPFAISMGKLYAAPRDFCGAYRSALLENATIARNYKKTIEFMDSDVLLLTVRNEPFRTVAEYQLMATFPAVYEFLHGVKRALSGQKRKPSSA